MTQPPTVRKTSPWPAVIAVGVLLMFGALFAAEMAAVSGGDTGLPPAEETLVAETYAEEVAALLADADPERGAAHATRYGCTSCHTGAGAQNRLAPAWEGVATRAATRRPPLSAEAYLYESIVYPRAHEIEGYSGQMPLIYARTIPPEALGDLIAYLMTYDEE